MSQSSERADDKYHTYVFDTDARQLVGDFQAMYVSEEREGFGSWHGHDARQLRPQIANVLLSHYNFAVFGLVCTLSER